MESSMEERAIIADQLEKARQLSSAVEVSNRAPVNLTKTAEARMNISKRGSVSTMSAVTTALIRRKSSISANISSATSASSNIDVPRTSRLSSNHQSNYDSTIKNTQEDTDIDPEISVFAALSMIGSKSVTAPNILQSSFSSTQSSGSSRGSFSREELTQITKQPSQKQSKPKPPTRSPFGKEILYSTNRALKTPPRDVPLFDESSIPASKSFEEYFAEQRAKESPSQSLMLASTTKAAQVARDAARSCLPTPVQRSPMPRDAAASSSSSPSANLYVARRRSAGDIQSKIKLKHAGTARSRSVDDSSDGSSLMASLRDLKNSLRSSRSFSFDECDQDYLDDEEHEPHSPLAVDCSMDHEDDLEEAEVICTLMGVERRESTSTVSSLNSCGSSSLQELKKNFAKSLSTV